MFQLNKELWTIHKLKEQIIERLGSADLAFKDEAHKVGSETNLLVDRLAGMIYDDLNNYFGLLDDLLKEK